MNLQEFICNAMLYCNPLNYNISKEIEKAQLEIEKQHESNTSVSDTPNNGQNM